MALPPLVLKQFAAHAGCARVADVVRVGGVNHDIVRGWRRRGITERVHHGVDRLLGAPETDEQALWAALLRCGAHALAGPRTSCWLLGLEGFGTLDVDVVLQAPHRCRGTAFPAPTRRIGPGDRTTVRGYPALSAARAIIEVAHTCSAKDLRVLIDSARRRRLLSIGWLRRRAQALRDEPGCCRGARAVLAMIGSGTMEQESENEREIEVFLATTTLQLDWQVTDLVPGRRLDAVDRAAAITLEIDSRLWHTLGSDRDADGLRDLEIAVADGPNLAVFHLTLGMVRFEPERTRELLDALRRKRLAALGPAS